MFAFSGAKVLIINELRKFLANYFTKNLQNIKNKKNPACKNRLDFYLLEFQETTP